MEPLGECAGRGARHRSAPRDLLECEQRPRHLGEHGVVCAGQLDAQHPPADSKRDQLLADRSLTFEDIAKSEGVVPSYATRLFRLTILAPDIVSAILSGRHPPELTARRLMDDTRLPLDWNDQRRRLGFASAH